MTTILSDKADFTRHMVRCLIGRCQNPVRGIDGMKLIQLMAGVMVETVLLFDESDRGLESLYARLADMLACEPQGGALAERVLPAPYLIDRDTEHGRALARRLFEEWPYCTHEFMDLSLFTVQQMVVAMEEDGQPRAEVFRLLIECTNRCLAYEIAAQELCDIVIDRKIGAEGWSLCESISGLSAVAGRCLALSRHGHNLPEDLDKVAYVMTAEAVRLGIPAGTDWRFGLAANDLPTSAPYELIAALEPVCRDFFALIGLNGMVDQAVACAKASGRMLALISGGERPEVEPVIAKPLAMAAMSDTYKTVCREYAVRA
ncbi:MAG: hypothetical protein HYU57_08110 [Micavibrio aeruginosavorus]|nr:hypothetical protein [Micavibrio aeruginosavorus]